MPPRRSPAPCFGAVLGSITLLLTACSSAPEEPPVPPRSPAVVDIVGSAVFVQPQTGDHGALPSFVEVWAQEAKIDPKDARLVYSFTGDGGGVALFCRLREPLTAEELRDDRDSLAPDDPARATATYALEHLPYLYDATFAVLDRRLSRDEASQCRRGEILYEQLVLGNGMCGNKPCPLVLLVKVDRVTRTPLARRLVQAIAADPGLLGDPGALALAGVTPLEPEEAQRVRETARLLLARPVGSTS